eukprot:7465234-Pyramimonas_sp.AAC.1
MTVFAERSLQHRTISCPKRDVWDASSACLSAKKINCVQSSLLSTERTSKELGSFVPLLLSKPLGCPRPLPIRSPLLPSWEHVYSSTVRRDGPSQVIAPLPRTENNLSTWKRQRSFPSAPTR